MAKYAYFDATVPAPAPVIGWFDTDSLHYPNLPAPDCLLTMTAAQWAGRLTGFWAVGDAMLIPYQPPVSVAPPAAPSLAQQATALLAGGLRLQSQQHPGLNGVYDCSALAQTHLQAELMAILLDQTFADGTTILTWPDANHPEVRHQFPDTATFKAFASGLLGFVARCYKVINGIGNTLPPATMTIP